MSCCETFYIRITLISFRFPDLPSHLKITELPWQLLLCWQIADIFLPEFSCYLCYLTFYMDTSRGGLAFMFHSHQKNVWLRDLPLPTLVNVWGQTSIRFSNIQQNGSSDF